jgi:hypothetical protein
MRGLGKIYLFTDAMLSIKVDQRVEEEAYEFVRYMHRKVH